MPRSSCCGTWDAQSTADSAAAAYANVLWDELVQNLFVRGRETAAPLSGQGRLFLVVDRLLDDPSSPWWNNPGLDISGQKEMLERTAEGAYERLAKLQGDRPERWNWGAAARADPHERHVRIVRRRADRVALQPRAVPGGRRQLDRQRDGLDPRRGLRDRDGAVDAHDRRPRRTSTPRAGTTSPEPAVTPSTRTTWIRSRRGSAWRRHPGPSVPRRSMRPRPTRSRSSRHPDRRAPASRGVGRSPTRGEPSERAPRRRQPPAAGGVSRDSASSSTCSECRSIVPLR